MNSLYSLFVFVVFVLLSYRTSAETNDTLCGTKNNTDCRTCLAIDGCAFCKTNKHCFAMYRMDNVVNGPCAMDQTQAETCLGNFKIWIIVIAVIAGVILLAAFIIICCLCRKCKKCKIRKNERRVERDEQRMEERRAAAEVRTAERNRVADQIRMKYGILKDKDTNNDYARME